MAHIGSIKQIIGVVIDVAFSSDYVPSILDALEVEGTDARVVLEVQQQLGDNMVRTIAMSPVDGLKRGMKVRATEAAITVPVGDVVLGRMFNVLGDPIDEMPAPKAKNMLPIHRKSPEFTELSTKTEVFETGIKVVDLIAPMLKG
ncbi:MAG: F0F1 ATP synthase subunit beta, partial [Candidatus Gracilibacteria bacterium]|nr:F0F1 ATP synthase subunit beta [Candidatus Gracilibacteria bacterium]